MEFVGVFGAPQAGATPTRHNLYHYRALFRKSFSKLSRFSTIEAHIVTLSLLISGATGRVGRALCELAQRDDAIRIAGALASDSSSNRPLPGRADIRINADPAPPIDAVIDFSTDAGCRRAVESALAHHAALLVATTALRDETHARIAEAARRIPVIIASNTAPGACVLGALAERATRALGTSYDVSIIEAHRAAKRDAPSGTAIKLAQEIRNAGAPLDAAQILSIRAGDTIGEHTVRFTGVGETLELTHRVLDRRVFAAGAIRAVRWLVGRPPGVHRVEDALGL